MSKVIVWDFENEDSEVVSNILGDYDKNLLYIADYFHTELTIESNKVYCSQEEKKDIIKVVFDKLLALANNHIDLEDVSSILNNQSEVNFFKEKIANGLAGKQYYIRSDGQNRLWKAFEQNSITIAYGPAGTGKTFLAVVYALNLLKNGKVRKIIITRPVVEAGESLGYLPGDLKEKIDPYLRPIYDSIEMIMGNEGVSKLLEKNSLEIAPLAYMRGRTLNDSIVILDEAQNTTQMQMKMFLTRLGFNSKMIITGDTSQTDLPSNKKSGLIDAIEVLKDIEDIAIISTSNKDVVRHPVVGKIIEAYEKN